MSHLQSIMYHSQYSIHHLQHNVPPQKQNAPPQKQNTPPQTQNTQPKKQMPHLNSEISHLRHWQLPLDAFRLTSVILDRRHWPGMGIPPHGPLLTIKYHNIDMIITKKEKMEDFYNHINSLHVKLKFTKEVKKDGSFYNEFPQVPMCRNHHTVRAS